MGIHGMNCSNSWAKLAPRFFAPFLGRKRAIFSKGLWAALERLWMAMLHYEVMTTPLGIGRMYQLWHSLSIFSLESGVSHRLRIADVHSEMPAACTHCISEQTYLQQSWWIWPCQIKKGWQAYSNIYIRDRKWSPSATVHMQKGVQRPTNQQVTLAMANGQKCCSWNTSTKG